MTEKTIKIAGAGISGLTAGINLAKAGFSVVIYEKGKTSGERFNGDFQSIENWSSSEDALEFLKRINIEINFPLTPYDGFDLWTAGGVGVSGECEKAGFYLVKRGTGSDCLDQILLRQALSLNNLYIEFEHPVWDLSEMDIVATGPFMNDRYVDAMASGYKFKIKHENLAVMILDDDLAPDGYGYCLIRDGEGVATTVAFRDYNKLSVCRDEVLNLVKKNLEAEIEITGRYAGIGNFFFGRTPPDGKIYVGEAGGFQDALWGFGMRNAFLTGFLAARSIIGGLDYYRTVSKKMRLQMKASVTNRALFALLNAPGYRFLARILPGVRLPVNLLGKMYSNTLIHKALFPVANLLWRKNTRDPRDFS